MSNRTQYPPIEPFDTRLPRRRRRPRRSTTSNRATRTASPRCSCTAVPAAAATSMRGVSSIPTGYRIVVFDQRGSGTQPPACLARSQHDLASRRRHGALAPPSRDRSLARVRRLVGQHARARVCGNASGGRQRARAARHLPAAAARAHWFYQFGASLLFPEQWQKLPGADSARGAPRLARRVPSALAVGRRSRASRGRARVVGVGRCHELAAAESEARGPVRRRRSSRWRSRASRPTISSIAASSRTRTSCSTASTHPAASRPSSCMGATTSCARSTRRGSCTGAGPRRISEIVPDAGHSAYEPGITAELIAATDRFLGRA